MLDAAAEAGVDALVLASAVGGERNDVEAGRRLAGCAAYCSEAMSELPRTDDPPRSSAGSGDGYDRARIDEAFAVFADRVRELEAVAGELRAELRALRAERRPAPFLGEEEWPAEAGARRSRLEPSPDWVASVPPPLAHAFAVPRILLEGAFLLLIALLAGLADLSAAWIVVVMATAWALVALSEWSATAKRARWRLDEIPGGVDVESPAMASDSTGPWNMPVVQATAIEAPDGSESHTAVTSLPVEPEASEEEASLDSPAPVRRGLRFWRRPAEATPDPWET